MRRKLLLTFVMMLMFLSMCGFREDEKKVFDDGNLLSDSEEATLQELCIEKAKETELDIIVVTTKDLGYKSTTEYADDFYDNGRYGYEYENGSGILFLISEDPSDSSVYISTAGLGILYIDDYDIETILDAGWNEFLDYNYYDCLTNMINETQDIVSSFTHLSGTDEIVDAWYEGEYDDYADFINDYDYEGREPNLLSSIMISGAISAAVSGIVILIMNSAYKNKMTVSGKTYFRDNSFRMHNQYDNFLRTDVSRVRIESSSSSGGGGGRSGGSFHSSSSGSSHGGGGRSR